ncbi:protein of unknown function [Methylocella tundrae]|uniref:Uncharacterized protein n=1 Tax=Methylocella tundrae TaxID=227605 RepID=A0A4U8Z5F8_METTU|nr:protein of unknown function [Methylocella tundrae]
MRRTLWRRRNGAKAECVQAVARLTLLPRKPSAFRSNGVIRSIRNHSRRKSLSIFVSIRSNRSDRNIL